MVFFLGKGQNFLNVLLLFYEKDYEVKMDVTGS